jgi:hypothetical protein
MTTNNRISNIVASQLPHFVRNDHENFVRFLEAYYEYLEQNGKPIDFLKNALDYRDVDKTLNDFSRLLNKHFLSIIPRNAVVDKNLLLKNVKDLYRSKGTEKATRFLLGILLNSQKEADFYYPKKDILRASDGKWYVKKTLKIKDFTVNNVSNSNVEVLDKFVNKTLIGEESGATAVVERRETYIEKGFLVNELEITNQKRNFSFAESVKVTFEEEGQTKLLRANIYSGIITNVKLLSGGKDYVEGDLVPIESNTGSGGVIRIDSVTIGGINTIVLRAGVRGSSGAGFRAGDRILVTGGGGVGAEANVLTVVTATQQYHPNSYNLVLTTIGSVANVFLNAASYANMTSANANTTIGNSVSFWTYANTGPFESAIVAIKGRNYRTSPTLNIIANTRVQALGILGRMEIVDGGLGYAVGNKIEFINRRVGELVGTGSGAVGNVTATHANGKITTVKFEQMPGHIIGGSGYSQEILPTANVLSTTGNGANIVVTAVLGDGESLRATTDTIGTILKLTLLNGGSGYETPPTINLKALGDGTAQASSNILTGVYFYAGRYINDDGHLSSFNFLQDRDYYQNYSYVVRLDASLREYRKALLDLLHPAGMKLLGEYLFEDTDVAGDTIVSNHPATYNTSYSYAYGNYASNVASTNVRINISSHGLSKNDAVYIEFTSGNIYSNAINTGYYTVNGANAGTFFITYENNIDATGNALIYYAT